ncbi:ABC transporter substrate-binding protein [Corynebacterium sp. 335C]
MRTTRPLIILACTAALPLGLAACSADDAGQAAGDAAATATSAAADAAGGSGDGSGDEAAWPRTVTVGDADVEVKEEPRRIAILSPGAASLASEIVPADRIAAITDLGPATPEGPEVIRGSANVDPEQVLAMNPDLVIVTARHGQEKDAGSLLRDSGLPVAVFGGDQWGSIDDMLANLATIGELTGREDAAKEAADRIESARAEVREAVEAHEGDAPRVLALMSRGGKQMIMSPSTLLNGLIEEAGGEPLAREAGGRGAAPADPERIAELNPDVILIEDFRGQGEEAFASLLANPALADVTAIKDDRVAYLAPSVIGVSSGPRVTEGLKAVAEAIGTLKK